MRTPQTPHRNKETDNQIKKREWNQPMNETMEEDRERGIAEMRKHLEIGTKGNTKKTSKHIITK